MSGYWDVLHAKGGAGRAWDDVFEGRGNAKGREDEGAVSLLLVPATPPKTPDQPILSMHSSLLPLGLDCTHFMICSLGFGHA